MRSWVPKNLFSIYQKLSGEDFFKAQEELNKSQWYSSDQLQKIQWKGLKELLVHSARCIPYYRRKFKELNISIESLQSPEDILRIPILTKEEVRKNSSFLRDTSYKGRLVTFSTSGSSGEPLIISLQPSAHGSYQAAQFRGFGWYGIQPEDRWAKIWGVPILAKDRWGERMKDLVMNRLRLSAFDLSPKEMVHFFDNCERFKIRYLYGYPTALYQFSNFLKENQFDAGRLGLRAVVTTSEMLYDFQRELISLVFRCKVANEYGAAEAGIIAFECAEGKMHISCENVYIEFLKEGKRAVPGELAEIVVTSLKNYYMPFIRYQLGDMGRYSEERCRCGRELPILSAVEGRDNDIVVTPTGKRVHSEVFSYINRALMNRGIGIKEFKIIQKTRSELDVLIVRQEGVDESAVPFLKAQMHQFLGEGVSIEVDYVDRILPERSGKVRYFVSELPPEDMGKALEVKAEMRKHLLLTADFPPIMGGVSVLFYNLWKNLPSNEVVILAPDVKGARELDVKESFKVYRKKHLTFESSLGRMVRPLLFVGYALNLFKKERIGSVHCAELLPSTLAGFFLNLFYKVPYFVYVTGSEFRSYDRSIFLKGYMRIILKRAQKVIAISEFARKEVIQRTDIDEKRVVIITPGVDSEHFRLLSKDPEMVKRYRLEGKRVILTVSRLYEHKGHDKVIEAMPLILEKIPNAVYLIVGSGPMEMRLKSLVKKLALEDHVLFVGYISDELLPQFYNLCDVFVLATREVEKPGWVEGFGIVFLEANACGKPVISGRTGGAIEAVLDQKTGLLINPFNINEIAEATVRLLNDPELASRLGNNGRKRVIEQFAWEDKAKKIGQLLGL